MEQAQPANPFGAAWSLVAFAAKQAGPRKRGFQAESKCG